MSFPGFALGVEQAEGHRREKETEKRDEREAKLQTLVNSGLPPAQVQQGIRDIYGQDAPALQRHVENLFRRVAGKQPQQAQAPMRAADLAGLEAQGTTPEQRQEARFKTDTDYQNQQGLQYEQQAAQQKQQRDFALIDQYVTDPEQNKSLKQAYVQRVAEGTTRPSADQQKRSDYQTLLASGQVPKDAQGNPLSYEAWTAYSGAQGRAAGTASAPLKVGSFGEFVTSQFGPQPTPEQIIKARAQWAQAAAGTTVGTHTIAVPQPDNTIKYYQVTTSSSKSFPEAGGGPSAGPSNGAPAPRGTGGGVGAPKHSAGTPIPRLTGDVTGGHPPPGFTKAQNDVTEATKMASIAHQVEKTHDAFNQKRLLVALERASAGRFTVQALDYIKQAGWGNSLEEWMNKPGTGEIPADIVRQAVAGADQNLKGAQDALNALKKKPSDPAPSGGGGGAKGTKSLKAAMSLPQNKGKTAEQVTQDLQAHGYGVAP
jgi:hypothetical protein